MWGIESQLKVVRERMKLLLEAHGSDITSAAYVAAEGELLLEQGSVAKKVLLLHEGSVAIQLRRSQGEPHTLAIIQAEEILGEMGLFGNGVHSADVRVTGGPAQLTVIDGDQLLQAMLFDSDLNLEILALLCQRCLISNQLVGVLLDGITAAHARDEELLEQSCDFLRRNSHSLSAAAEHLSVLHP